MIESKIRGIPDLRDALLTIAPRLRKRALRNALAAAGRVVRDAARQRVPILNPMRPGNASAIARGIRKPGTVRKALVVRTSKTARRAGDVGVFVNVRPARGSDRGGKNPNDPFYARWLQWGSNKMAGVHFLEAGAARLGDALDVFLAKIGPAIEKLNTGPKAEP